MNVKQAVRKTPCILRFVPQLLLITTFASGQPVFPQTRIVPDSGWVKIYYEAIDELTKRMGLAPLRSIQIKSDDLEIRIWSGFGGSGITGEAIKRTNDKWSSISMVIPSGGESVDGQPVEQKLKTAPDSIDWPVVWEKLERAGINEIRDDSEIQRCSRTLDGISYVVEIARSDFYRTYHVANPRLDRSEDGDRFLNILSILAKATGGESTYIEAISLPRGEIKTVSFVSNDIPTQPSLSPQPTEWTYATDALPKGLQESLLSTEQLLAQALILNTPSCADRTYPSCCFASGDVAIDLLISPDGSVYAARALSGPPNLKKLSSDFALKWKFLLSADQSQLRRAALSMRYVRQWVRFPWLK
jgi:hypothetical protein